MTYSRNKRKKQLRKEKGPSTKAQTREQDKTMKERLERLKKRPKQLSIRNTKIGRNDTCPCGSGKKYKICCLIVKEDTIDVESTEKE